MLRILSIFRPSSELLTEQEKNGKTYIFYPAGFLYNSFDGQINQSFPMDFIPGFVNFALHSFKFKHKLNHMANLALQKAKEEYLAKKLSELALSPVSSPPSSCRSRRSQSRSSPRCRRGVGRSFRYGSGRRIAWNDGVASLANWVTKFPHLKSN